MTTLIIELIAALILGIIIGYVYRGTWMKSATPNTNPVPQYIADPVELEQHLISNRMAKQMIEEYIKLDPKLPNVPNSKSLQLSRDSIYYYLDQMQDITDLWNGEVKISGLRVFFARYPHQDPKSSTYEEVLPDKMHVPGQVTIVMYPTYFDGKNHIAFDPKVSKRKGKIVTVKEILDGNWSQNDTLNDDGKSFKLLGETPSAYNKASTSPPQ